MILNDIDLKWVCLFLVIISDFAFDWEYLHLKDCNLLEWYRLAYPTDLTLLYKIKTIHLFICDFYKKNAELVSIMQKKVFRSMSSY